MNKINVIGIDLGKNAFQVHGVDQQGQQQVQRQFTRTTLKRWLVKLAPCCIGMETCSGAHHLGRWLSGLGHEVHLMSPQFVRAYVKSNKNDARDAEAICEAVSRPTMRFVPIKTVEQQELQIQHRVRPCLSAYLHRKLPQDLRREELQLIARYKVSKDPARRRELAP